MSEDLPISLNPGDFDKAPVANLEAWINFETLRAGWYGDEARILNCHLTLLDTEAFDDKAAELQQLRAMVAKQHGFAMQIDKETLNVEGFMLIDLEDVDSEKSMAKQLEKQLKQRLKKVFVILAATLCLEPVFSPKMSPK